MKNYISFPTDIKTNLTKIAEDYEELSEDSSHDELEIEKLAKELTEEKDYLPYKPENEDEEE